MKISVSLPERDVAFLDRYAAKTSAESRSSVVHAAIELLRAVELEVDYSEAWQEWAEGEDAAVWEAVVGDGLADASR